MKCDKLIGIGQPADFHTAHENRVVVCDRREWSKTMLAIIAGGIISSQSHDSRAYEPPNNEHVDEKAYEQMSENARKYIENNLRENREAAKIYGEMLETIREFERYAKVLPIVMKCMDGRTQGNGHKGFPPGVAINRRTQGGITDITRNNRELWTSLHKAELQAVDRDASLLVIASGHRSDLSTGCAAFKHPEDELVKGHTDKRALGYMHEEALALRHMIEKEEFMPKGKVSVLSAMTNTDTGAMQIFKNDESIFDADGVILGEDILDPTEIFEATFLTEPIGEEWAHESIRGKKIIALFKGEEAPGFKDSKTRIALQTYLMRKISESSKGSSPGTDIVRHDILKGLHTKLEGFNPDLRTFLTYMMSMNVAHTVFHRNENKRLEANDPAKLRAKVDHGELKIAYSESGHDLEPRNSLLLIKPGSGDELKTLGVGKAVLEHNLQELHMANELPPIVHINIELTAPIDSWNDMEDVIARMRTKVGIVGEVFGKNVRMFTTYSYHQSVQTGIANVPCVKQFMPLNADHNNKRILVTGEIMDISEGMSASTFNANTIRERESKYSSQM